MAKNAATVVVHAMASTMNMRIAGPDGNPQRQCYGPDCTRGLLRRYAGKSRYWRHLGPSFGYRGNDYFCSLQCAMNWAVLKCDAGSAD